MLKQVASIKRSFVITLTGAIVASFLFSCLVFYQQYQAKLSSIQDIQDDLIFRSHNLFNRELGSIRQLMKLLVADNALKSTTDNSDSVNLNQINSKVLQHFIDFGSATDLISQIRWLDASGQERFRVNFENNAYEVIPENELQNKKLRYYFQQGMLVKPPNIYTSVLDLNIENKVIVKPYQPTLRATYRTNSSDYYFDGLLVVNFNLSDLFKQFASHSEAKAQLFVLNSEGHWLLHQDKSKEWAFMFDAQTPSLAEESPKLWQHIASLPIEEIGHFAEHRVKSFIKMLMFDDNTSEVETNYVILLVKSIDEVLQNLFWHAIQTAGLTMLILVAIFGVYLWREYHFKLKLLSSAIELQQEQQALTVANQKLNKNLIQQQKLQEDLVEAQKLSSLGMMVAGIAHEMNTPVGGAVISTSNAQVICQKLQDQIQKGLTKQYLDESLVSINDNLYLSRLNLDKAVMHIKSFKRMAIDRASEQLVSCDMNKIVDDLFAVLHPRFKTSRVALNKHIETNCNLVSRPGIISQLLENLILNALEHGFNEGEVGQIDVRVFNLDLKTICITVSDNGMGINPDLRDKLFEPFVTSSRNHGHTGLGLSMVKQWATKILQGSVSIRQQEELPKGISTQFEIVLPINISVL